MKSNNLKRLYSLGAQKPVPAGSGVLCSPRAAAEGGGGEAFSWEGEGGLPGVALCSSTCVSPLTVQFVTHVPHGLSHVPHGSGEAQRSSGEIALLWQPTTVEGASVRLHVNVL